ncbi:TolC family protein [Sphingomonas sp. LR60]|uniref:hypothetical protein n=1 Tax=Sphingomonas sp. LR60 TaxID=3050233 RepID=UPI002FE08AC8
MPLTPSACPAAPPIRALCSLSRARAGLAAAVALLFAGCAAPASHTSVEAKTPTALALAGPSVQLAPDWWHAIGDPQLDRLVADALAGNPSLDIASARVRQAQAALERQDAERRPSIDADAQVQGTRLSGNYTIPPPMPAPSARSAPHRPGCRGTSTCSADKRLRSRPPLRRPAPPAMTSPPRG